MMSTNFVMHFLSYIEKGFFVTIWRGIWCDGDYECFCMQCFYVR
jgi:hypothetical protein